MTAAAPHTDHRGGTPVTRSRLTGNRILEHITAHYEPAGVNANGYRQVYIPLDHPLAVHRKHNGARLTTGLHRIAAFLAVAAHVHPTIAGSDFIPSSAWADATWAKNRIVYSECTYCAYPTPWSYPGADQEDVVNVDHLDNNRANNHPTNLTVSCSWCNKHRATLQEASPIVRELVLAFASGLPPRKRQSPSDMYAEMIEELALQLKPPAASFATAFADIVGYVQEIGKVPSQRQLAHHLGCSQPTVRRAIAANRAQWQELMDALDG